MRVNISNDKITSIDFLTVDEGIDFIKKFNSSNSITSGTDTIQIDPNNWKQPWNPCNPYNPIIQPLVTYERKHDLDTYKVADPVPNPYTVTANIK